MIKKIKQLAAITAMIVLIFPTAMLAESAPTITTFVFGEVKKDGSLVSIGTVSAGEVSSTIGSDGKYSIELLDVDGDYKVDGVIAAKSYGNSTDTWKEINLSITTPESDPTPYCGDGTCDGDETCSNCSTDCGACATGSPSGGRSSYSPPPVVDEEEDEEEESLPEPEEDLDEEEEEVIVLGVETDYRAIQLNKIINEAGYIRAGDANTISVNMGANRDPEAEVNGYNKYTSALISGMDGLEQSNIYAITNFIVYGTETTKILGTGERAGVLNSYKSAFGKLPSAESEWQDAIKIANGRWPSEIGEAAEAKAKQEFKKVYLREPDMDNPNDNAAVTVIAYGLRPSDRNLDSEKAGIKTFKHIYGYNPSSATDWDVVRAIAYSGATR